MNENSSIIPSVIKYLEEDCLLLPQQNYVIKEQAASLSVNGEMFMGSEVTIFRVENEHVYICKWGEQFNTKEALVFYQGRGGLSPKEEATKIIIKTISSSSWIKYHLESPLFLEKKKNRELREENDLLLKKIERLRQKKRELKYAPGNKGALKAQQHFETLQEK
nr:ATP-dependent Zn protease [Marseillevirus sp.]